MRLLDLFSGAGGAGEGYRRAGFDVTGVDLEHHDYPCGDFIQADALQILAAPGFLAGFDVIHASPPCQAYSTITGAARINHPELIVPVRELLHTWGGTYVIENVEGARRHLDHPIRLCGSSFGLRVRRHRYFETNAQIVLHPPCEHARQGRPIGVYGDHWGDDTMRRPDGTRRGDRAHDLAEAQHALGIDWMSWDDLTESIPPAYTEWIGHQLIEHLAVAA